MKFPVIWQTVLLLSASNVFMTFAWYAHLKHLIDRPWWIAALISWGIALFEYLLQVPANRIGHSKLSLAQLKILQEVITRTIFIPFVVFYMQQPLKLEYLWAALCILGGVDTHFVERVAARGRWMLGARHRPHRGAGTASNNADAAPSRQPFGTASVRALRNVAAASLAPAAPCATSRTETVAPMK